MPTSSQKSVPLVFLSAFGLNLYRAFPSLSSYRDAGDFASAVSALGVAHPPGYPLYVLSGRLFQSAFPWANPLYRLNLFSAVCAAFAAALVYALLSRLAGRFAGAAGALMFAFLPAALSQSGLSEIYSLNAAIAAGLLFLIAAPDDGSSVKKIRHWALFAFVLGAGCGNHHTLLALVPAAAVVLFRERRAGRLRPAAVAAMVGLFAAGVTLYLAPVLRGLAGARYVWGEPAALGGFIDLLTRADYGAATLSTRLSSASADRAVFTWFKSWAAQWGTAGVLLWLGSALWAFGHARRRAWGGVVLTLWIIGGPVFGLVARLGPGELSRAILEPAMLLPGLAGAVLAGAFAGALWRRGGLPRFAAAAVLAAHVFFRASPAFFQNLQRWNLIADDYGRNLLRALPPGSPLLMISDGAIFSVEGRREVYRERPDVRLLVDAPLDWRWRRYRARHPELFAEGQGDGGRELLRAQSGSERIFTEGLHPGLVDSLCPRGMAAAAAWPSRGDGCLDAMAAGDALWGFYVRRVPPAEVLAADYYSRSLARTAASSAYNAGLLLQQAGREEPSRRYFARALFWSPERWMRWTELR